MYLHRAKHADPSGAQQSDSRGAARSWVFGRAPEAALGGSAVSQLMHEGG